MLFAYMTSFGKGQSLHKWPTLNWRKRQQLLEFQLQTAETAEKHFGQQDKERELTQRGVREALLIGSHLY